MGSAMEYPTIRWVQASVIAHRYSLPSVVGCSVMSVSHNRFGVVAVNARSTKSSWTGGPDIRLRPRLRAWLLKIRCWVHSRLTRLRLAVMPWPASSSVMKR